MITFNNCIWLSNKKKSSKLTKLTNGFRAHMTIQSKLKDLNKAKHIFNIIPPLKTPIRIKFSNSYKVDYAPDGFNSMFYDVYFVSTPGMSIKPLWWPEHAHVSFIYKYNKSLEQSEIDIIDKEIKNIKFFDFDIILLMKCEGHHTTWKQIS